jgi:quercetin dioxygenase-like cupin family protein
MKGKFITASEMARDHLDWGTIDWICRPEITGASDVTVMYVTLKPGAGHAFHVHPNQEEVIYVLSGKIEQWLEAEKQLLLPGDSVFIDANVVHASFNESDGPTHLMVVLGPCDGPGGYIAVEVADQEPWRSLR